jgi:hypothetical protein
MKSLLYFVALFFVIPALAQQSSEPLQAEVLRSTTGRTLDERGLSSGTMSLKKGMIFDVAEQKMGFVVLLVSGKKVAIPSGEVSVSPKSAVSTESQSATTDQTAQPPFVPGQIVLISAKYSLEGNQPRNVKNRLSKLVPNGVITAPVSILVTDELSSAAMSQGNVSQGTIVNTGSGTAAITLKHPAKNILTVQYSFNGQLRTKQAVEGSYLMLP